jgi:death on curing protein
VLVVRLARNHPLPDGNKRAAWVTLRLFVEINDWTWDPTPMVDDADAAVLSVAGGEWDQTTTATWLRNHLQPLDPSP